MRRTMRGMAILKLEPGGQVRVVTAIAAPDGNYQLEVEVRSPRA